MLIYNELINMLKIFLGGHHVLACCSSHDDFHAAEKKTVRDFLKKHCSFRVCSTFDCLMWTCVCLCLLGGGEVGACCKLKVPFRK